MISKSPQRRGSVFFDDILGSQAHGVPAGVFSASAPTLAEAVKLVTAALAPANPTALAEKAPPPGTP